MQLLPLVAAALVAASFAVVSRAAPAAEQGVVISQSIEQTHTQSIQQTHTQSIQQTHTIDPARLEQLPAVELTVLFESDRGTEAVTYKGPLLWSVLEDAGVLGADRRARIRQTIVVTGRDGYTAALALAEIDPQYEGKQVLLAYRRNGHAMDGSAVSLVVPGDRRGGRNVSDVVRIDLR
jgi:hypothetical protein